MKKVCFVIPRAYYLFNPDVKGAEDKVGGAQKQSYLLSISLAEDENFDVNFLVADFGQQTNEKINNVKIYKSFNFSHNILKRTTKLLKTLKKINAGTYIFRSADIGVAFAVFYIKNVLKKKILYMLAADTETTKKRQRHHSGFLTALAMQFVYKKANVITAQTRQQSDSFKKDRKRPPDAIIKNIYSVKNDTQTAHDNRHTILWVGRLDKIKNPELFIRLAEKYQEEEFVMIAPVVRDYPDYGNEIHKKSKHIKNLKVFDFVSPEKISDYYKKAKIYILSSDLEGFSNTMAEAMISECPILSFNVNPDNILSKYNCGFCADKKLQQFYSDFEKLNNNHELRKQLGQNGAKYIKENHQNEGIIKTFKKLL